MTEEKEELSDYEKLLSVIMTAGQPSYEDYVVVRELLNNTCLQRVLHRILTDSDDRLVLVSKSDFGNDETRKVMLKTQGEAIGLSQAVETIVELATTKEKDHV